MKKIYFFFVCILVVASSLLLDNTSTHSRSNGSPESASGSPFDGVTCAKSGCHAGTASAQDNMVTSNIPASGYIPGQTYTITVSISQAGISKFGFSISPQNSSGAVLGSLVITNTAETQLKNVGHQYVTHTTAGNAGTGSKTWSFDWIAPTVGTGAVPFYAAVNAANGNGTASGDQIYTDVYTVDEDITTQILENISDEVFSVFPNPADGNTAQVSFNATALTSSRIRIMSLNGTIVNEISHLAKLNGNQVAPLNLENLSKGVYFVEVKNSTGTKMTRIIRR
jgi:hypothetical protein